MRVYGAVAAVLGLAGLGLWVALFPPGFAYSVPLAVALLALFAWRPVLGVVLATAAWPIADVAPWTGQIHVTETDALACAALCSIGARYASRSRRRPDGLRKGATLDLFATGLFALLALGVVVSTWRGMAAYQGEAFAFTLAGLDTPINALRLAKPYVFALLAIPFLHDALARSPDRTHDAMRLAFALGLGTCAAAATWERIAFPGLTNLSSDYRTTALFWEMNVGGAALDGWLAIALPFAIILALRARTTLEAGASAMLVALGAYATLTSFSRGLYLAVGASIVVLVVAQFTRTTARGKPSASVTAPSALADRLVSLIELGLAAIALIALFIAFSSGGGYRGMGATLACALLVHAAGPRISGLGVARLVAALLLAAGAAVLAGACATLIPKGPYVMFGLAATSAAALIVLRGRGRPRQPDLGLAGIVLACGALAANVGWHWGGDPALPGAAAASILLAIPLIIQALCRAPAWSFDPRRGALAAAILTVGGLVAATANSYYAAERFSTVGNDLRGRIEHWTDSAGLVRGLDAELFGIGMGRYSQEYFWTLPAKESPGTWTVVEARGERFLRLGGPRYPVSFGDIFRVSQRVATDVLGPVRFEFDVRADRDSGVHLEVCRKHLLYTGDCSIANVPVGASRDWQRISVETKGNSISRAVPWTLPRLAYFSVGLLKSGKVEIDNLRAMDAEGRPLLVNGDFAHGADYWFFTSDRHHLPWHAKNLLLHLYVEQGVVGSLALAIAAVLAIARTARAARASAPAAATILAALLAFLAVGAFDSLLDVPRLTLPFLLLLWTALVMKAPVSPAGAPTAGTGPAPAAPTRRAAR